MLNGLWSDLAHAARSLANARAFTFVCVVSLGIGMVPVIAVPYVARITRTPPPGVTTDGLVEVVTTPRGPRAATDAWSYPDVMDLRDTETGMTIAGWINGESKTTIQTPAGARTQSVSTMFVSANYFRVVGVTLARGPGFDATNDSPAAAPAVILGHEFWQNHGADPDMVGKTLTLDDVPHVVAGIAPDGFDGHLFLHGQQIFAPLERHRLLRDRTKDVTVRFDRGNEWIYVAGRLSRGVDIAQASAAVSA